MLDQNLPVTATMQRERAIMSLLLAGVSDPQTTLRAEGLKYRHLNSLEDAGLIEGDRNKRPTAYALTPLGRVYAEALRDWTIILPSAWRDDIRLAQLYIQRGDARAAALPCAVLLESELPANVKSTLCMSMMESDNAYCFGFALAWSQTSKGLSWLNESPAIDGLNGENAQQINLHLSAEIEPALNLIVEYLNAQGLRSTQTVGGASQNVAIEVAIMHFASIVSVMKMED